MSPTLSGLLSLSNVIWLWSSHHATIATDSLFRTRHCRLRTKKNITAVRTKKYKSRIFGRKQSYIATILAQHLEQEGTVDGVPNKTEKANEASFSHLSIQQRNEWWWARGRAMCIISCNYWLSRDTPAESLHYHWCKKWKYLCWEPTTIFFKPCVAWNTHH